MISFFYFEKLEPKCGRCNEKFTAEDIICFPVHTTLSFIHTYHIIASLRIATYNMEQFIIEQSHKRIGSKTCNFLLLLF